ncbi:hypothetical protein GN958_ATG02904 [Phytophthora infestans]|uniref:Uncharacterized protein n=1 Tax=Phytophthora infestans TaxID=4787 RepID=A0A8S9V976_PHYIN|nr:hypothetical protein GN958_ATG02904 [Phytophthora infestans]
MELESVTVLRDKLRKLAVSIITRLGNPFGDKTDDDYNARKLVQDMEDDVASYSQPSNPNSTRFHLSRVDHTAVTDAALAPVLDSAIRPAYADFVIENHKLVKLWKRLLKIPLAEREPSEFREFVQTYSTARDSMCLGQASSPKTFSRLEWYLANTVEDYEQQLVLDGMLMWQVFATWYSDSKSSLWRAELEALLPTSEISCFRIMGHPERFRNLKETVDG